MGKKKIYNVLRMRKCPKCGSKDYRRGITYGKITEVKNGKRTTYWRATDAGYFECLKCGFYEAN